MAVERQAVQGMPIVQSRGGPGVSMVQSRTPTSGGTLMNSSSAFLDDLVSVAGNGMKLATDYLNNVVEEDKVRQYDRTLRGLLPTEDATVGGTRAHMLVNLQNRANDISSRLKDEATRFQGTDEEWEEQMVTYQRALREEVALNYPELQGDKDTPKLITATLLEQQPGIFAARTAAKLQQESAERQQSMTSRMAGQTEGLHGEQLNESLHRLQQEAVTLQITKPEFEDMVVKMAMERAAVGDPSMIDATKHIKDADGVSLYARNGKLMQAEISADRTKTSLDQVGLFQMKNDISQKLMTGDLSWDEFLEQSAVQNQATGSTAWSDGELTSIYNQRAKQAANSQINTELLQKGEQTSPLGLQDISDKERKDYAESLRAVTTALADKEIAATGATGEEAESIRGKFEQQRLMHMAKNVIEDPVAKSRFESLMLMSPENLKTMTEEPEAMQTLLRTRDSLPETSLRSVLGDKAWAFTENYQRALDMGQNVGQAISFAQNASRGEKLQSSTLKELNKTTETVVDSVASGGWTWGDNMSDMGKELMRQEANQIALSMKQAGHNNETIEKEMKNYLSHQYTQTQEGFFKAGVLVKGVQSQAELGKVIGTNATDAGQALDQYITANEQTLLDSAGMGMTREDLYYDIDQKKGTFVIRAGSGRVPVTMAAPLSTINGQALLKDKYEKAQTERDKNKADFEASMMKRGAWGVNTGSVYQKSADVTIDKLSKTGLGEFFMSSAFADGTNLPSNFEFGYEKNNQDFRDYIAGQENPNNIGFNRASGSYEPYNDSHGESVGYGHFITDQERINGYIVIDGNKVPFVKGSSQITPEQANKLLDQDLKSHVPSTSDWKTPFKELHPSVQRGIMDLSYNLGKGGIAAAPKANASFKSGKITDGFIHMLSTASEQGKRSTGLLVRRADSYNIANASSGLPKITTVETNADGSMRVKFSGEMSSAFVSPDIAKQIGSDGWMTVYPAKANALSENSKPGSVSLE
jgi:GH24 family phage-related lysozyme (muramidase)